MSKKTILYRRARSAWVSILTHSVRVEVASKGLCLLFLLTFAFLFSFNLVHAEVVINEIQLNPAAERFIELYNSGNSAVDLNGWYLQRKTATGSDFSSLISKTYFENKMIEANGYFLISKNSLGLSTFTLTESNAIQLKNLEQKVVNKIGWGDGEASVIGNPPDGKSIQNTGHGWIIASPTPGAQNSSDTQRSNDTSDSSNISIADSFIQTKTETKTKITEIPKVKTKITAKTLAFTGIPVEFSASATGYSNESLSYGKYFWNFGDGDSKETRTGDTAKFTHTFFYEGEYTVALEYYMNYYSENPDAYDAITINVIQPNISISKVGDEKDFFVEISNNTEYNADLSKWILASDGKSFTFPKNMILEPEKKIILSPKITGFSILDKETLKLENSQRETVFNYSTSIKPAKILARSSVPTKISIAENKNIDLSENNTQTETPVDNLLAEAVKSDTNTSDTTDNFKYGILGLFAFLGVGAGGAYFIRNNNRKVSPETAGSDFEIMDE